MPVQRFNRLFSRRSAWLFWFALLLPLAQVAASAHLLSHVHSEASGSNDDQHAIHLEQCDLCLAAVTVAGGAPLDHPVGVGSSSLTVVSLPGRVETFLLTLSALPYQSRAPPFVLI